MLKRAIHIVFFSFLYSVAAAQQFYMKGEVKDEAGNPLRAVAVIQQSTGSVFHTGASGTFEVPTNKNIDTLTFARRDLQEQKIVANAATFLTVVLKKEHNNTGPQYRLSSRTQNLTRQIQEQWFTGDESYASIVENQFVKAPDYPSTGLSLNVDRASYSNIRRFLNTNTMVPPDAVRIEEMLNYFQFSYSEPPNKKTFEIRSTLTQCPWNISNRLLFVNIKSKKVALDSLPPAHLVFLIDVSGSMDMPNRLPLLKAGFRGLINNLRDKDSVTIVMYGGVVRVALNTTGGAEKEKIFRAIDELTPEGATPGESGIRLAYRIARDHFIRKGNNRIILATDAGFNVGISEQSELEKLIEEQRTTGIHFTCLGVGMGDYKDTIIQALAQKGYGSFAYLDSYADMETVLIKEFMQTGYVVADNASLHVRFDPALVKQYRLIGFDNKMGAIKDTSTVLEESIIPSAYSMLAAFELVPADRLLADSNAITQPVTFSLKYRLPGKQAVREERQKPNLQFTPFQRLDKSHKFASSVIMLGMLLRESRVPRTISWDELSALAEQSVNTYNPMEKEFLALVQQAKNIYNKKKKKVLGLKF